MLHISAPSKKKWFAVPETLGNEPGTAAAAP